MDSLKRRSRRRIPIPILISLVALVLAAGWFAWRKSSAKTAVEEEGIGEAVEFPRDHPREALDFFRFKRAPVGEEVTFDRYLEAVESLETMPRHSARLDLSFPSMQQMERGGVRADPRADTARSGWEELGPGNIGGRTRALVIDNSDPRVLYAAGVAGGIWKTENGGQVWVPLDDLLANLGVVSLAMDPGNSDVLYAGTGEFLAGDGIRGAGIFKTENGGASWVQLPASDTQDFHHVSDIVVSSQNSQRVYAATGTGVWRSLNGGETWARVLAAMEQDGCLDLVLRTDQTSDALFAACTTAAGRNAVVHNPAAEGGGTWTEVLTEPGMGRISLAIASSDQNVVYALAASLVPGPEGRFENGLHAVFRSTRGGVAGSWAARNRNTSRDRLGTLLLTNPIAASSILCGFTGPDVTINQGDYDNVIAVDPVDPNRVWVGGVDLFRSDDGGATWGLASYWWFRRAATGFLHADQHALVFHPRYDGRRNTTLFVGNDGGIFRTDDALAATATDPEAPCGRNARFTWTPLNNNYRVTQFYHGQPYRDGRTYFGGTQDNGTLRGTDATGVNAWQILLGGDGGHVAVDPNDEEVLYAEFDGLSLRKSVNGGREFEQKTRGIEGDHFLFIVPFFMDPNDSRRLWLGGGSLWRTDDAAETWERASRPLATGEHGVSAIAVAPGDSDHVVAGTSDGRIYLNRKATSSDRRTAWRSTRPQRGYVSSLAFDPIDPEVVYATYSHFEVQHVWKSTDGGANWSNIDGSGEGRLRDIPVHSIVIDPANRDHLYIGTDLGVFASTNGGASWAVENTGFANVITESLTLQTRPDGTVMMFAFTHGRGAWRVRLPDRAPSNP